ncbi:MAG: radical SAM protein, partial [Bacteroidota bacterium]
MAKILFTHSYFYRFDPKQWEVKQPYPPYGTIYAAALMRSLGHEVQLFDTNLVENTDAIQPLIHSFQPDYLVVYDDGFNYLTKMCLTNMREAAFDILKLAKSSGAKTMVCSSDSTDHFQQYLQEGADFVLLGEGELTLKELITDDQAGTLNEAAVLGIAYQKDGHIQRNASRPVLRALDDLPDPAWDLIDMDSYKAIWLEHQGYFSLNMATTRGCPYKCNWCAKPIYGNRYNSRSPVRVAKEMKMLVDTYGVQHFWMGDDIFGLKPKWVQTFRDALDELDFRVPFKIQSRADLLLKEDSIQALADAGLQQVWIGAESGSQKILDAMDKGTTIDQIHQATKLLKEKGVQVCFFLQFGYLGEEKEDIQKTIDMMLELMPHDIGVSVSYPLPGTGFYETVKAQLKDKQ